MFEYLKKELAKEYKEERRSRAAFIVGGSGDDPDRGLRLYSTPAKWEAYKAGQITREKAGQDRRRRSGPGSFLC